MWSLQPTEVYLQDSSQFPAAPSLSTEHCKRAHYMSLAFPIIGNCGSTAATARSTSTTTLPPTKTLRVAFELTRATSRQRQRQRQRMADTLSGSRSALLLRLVPRKFSLRDGGTPLVPSLPSSPSLYSFSSRLRFFPDTYEIIVSTRATNHEK